MKRTITLFLALALILSSIATVFAADLPDEEEKEILSYAEERACVTSAEEVSAFHTRSTGFETRSSKLPFVDVPEGSWFHDNVAFVYETGLMNGKDKTHFVPSASLTRAELVTILYRLEKLYCGSNNKPVPVASTGMPFMDVPMGSYYEAAVAWASDNNIVKGVDSYRFNPNGLVTREQIATIFYRYYVYQGKQPKSEGSLKSFSDASKISSYARKPMEWAVGCGLIRGNANKTICPMNSATRAEAAVLMERMFKMLEASLDSGTDGSTGTASRCSQNLFNLIMEREGFSATPYWDVSQWSIGYGSRCGVERDGSDVPADYWNGITEAKALSLLKTYMAEVYEPSVTNYEKRHNLHFTQNQFDALADFTYALGNLWTSGGYKINNVLEHGGTDLEIADAFGSWCRVSGSVNLGTAQRRLLEVNIFLYGDYTGTGNHDQFCAVRYYGNGSKLTSKYNDDIGFFVVGKAYGSLLNPDYVGSDTKTFDGWKDNTTGKKVTNSTVAKSSTTLTAQWK